MPVIHIPALDKFPEVRGLFVGGCVLRGDGSSFRHRAHAHTGRKSLDLKKGWICFRSMKRVQSTIDTGKLNSILIHELSHILTGCGHNDKWRARVRELGGKLHYWETKEHFQLKHAGYRVRRRVGKRETKRLLAKVKK